jgi:FMN phosphatase YigB (HAD superfamily)
VHHTDFTSIILLFEKYSLIPNECVFIDDNAANIKAAQELGMDTIQFKGYSSARQELNKKTTQSVAVPKQKFLIK